jgi:hypothetical protein
VTDRLTLTRAFEGAGIESQAAERIATEIYDAIHENVATKTDVNHAVAALRGEMQAIKTDVDHAVATLRSDMQAMELRLKNQIDRMMIRLGGLVVVVAGLLFAALHYWAPTTRAPGPSSSSPAQHASTAARMEFVSSACDTARPMLSLDAIAGSPQSGTRLAEILHNGETVLDLLADLGGARDATPSLGDR